MQTSFFHAALTVTGTALLLKVKKVKLMALQLNSHRNIWQQEWQRDLLLKYGNTISLIDATYKTTRYELPLFFVCVRTNVGYSVVAEFILESECTESICEALHILHSWNPELNPKF